MNPPSRSTKELLTTLVGKRRAVQLSKIPLSILFQLRIPRQTASESLPQQEIDATLFAAKELVTRALADKLTTTPIRFIDKNEVADYLRLTLAGRPIEVFMVMFLDAQNRLIASEEMFQGTLSQTSVFPREVVKRVLYHNAGAVMFAHNHPSGRAEPSVSDRQLTDSLKQALTLIDVRVLDHIVVGEGACTSLAERGWV